MRPNSVTFMNNNCLHIDLNINIDLNMYITMNTSLMSTSLYQITTSL